MNDGPARRSPRSGLDLDRRDLFRLGAGAAAAVALSSCAYTRSLDYSAAAATGPAAKAKIDGDLVYFNWADYLDPTVVAGFKKEYGVKIIESNFDSMEGMDAKLQAGNQYDIIFPGAKWVERLRQQGRLQRIDHDQLKNAHQVFGTGGYFDNPWYDPQSKYSVPFTVYKTGMAWRTDKVDTMTGSWADLWNPKAAGKIYTLDNQDEALGMAALRLGMDVNTADSNNLDRVVSLLKSQKPLLRAYSSDDIGNLASGNAWIHHMWSGDFLYFLLNQATDPSKFKFQVAKEGVPINSDAYAIPANAKHPGTALLFIDYLLRPENAVKNIQYLCYPMPVKDAEGAFAALAKDAPECNVSLADLASPTVFKNLPNVEVQARSAAWTNVKAS